MLVSSAYAQNRMSYDPNTYSFSTPNETEKLQNMGIEIGYAQPILRENSLSNPDSKSNITRFHGLKVGLNYEADIIKGLGVRFGLYYTYGQANDKDWTSIGKNILPRQKLSSSLHGLDIPVEWQYKFTIAKQTYIILYTGPTFQYNISYQTTRTIQKDIDEIPVVENTKNHFNGIGVTRYDDDNKRHYRQFNLLWGVGAGFQYKNFYIRGGYDFGVINHYKDTYYNLGESIGYAPKGRLDQWQVKLGWYILNF